MGTIREADYQHWREHGYVVVPLLDDEQVRATVENIHEYMPPWEEYARHPRWYEESVAAKSGRLRTYATFPFVGDALNETTLHPELIAFAERVIGTDRLMLSHGQLGGKYAGTRDFEQQLHLDYGNNTLVCPPPDEEIVDLPAIIYYTDVTVDLSPTYVVSQKFTRDLPREPRFHTREGSPDLYAHEVPVVVPAGSVLIYSMNTFHRGSALTASEGLRYAQNIGFKRVDAPWCGQVTFQHDGGSPEMNHFLEHATPRQREFVGFPRVGDPYWNKSTVANVGARYPGMDMSPYLAALT
ncbi:phytanoyl-CoA dioxygenase family protein [Actinopolymorpha singaporensis]